MPLLWRKRRGYSNERARHSTVVTETCSLPADDQLFQGVASTATQITATQILVKPVCVHASVSSVQGRVCQDCNNGWMSRLEAAQPILIPLIDRRRPIASLTTEEKLTVSKWVAKTAYITFVFLDLRVALDFCDKAINIFRGIARLHLKEVCHHLLALNLRHPKLLDPNALL